MSDRVLERPPKTSIEHTVRVIAIVSAVILAVWLLSNVILIIMLAALIAVILRGLVAAAVRLTGAPQGLMLALISLLAATVALAFLYYLGPKLVTEMEQLWAQLAQEIGDLQTKYGGTTIGRLIFNQSSGSHVLGSRIDGFVATLATSAIDGVVTAFILIVTSLYFAISPRLYLNGIVRLFPIPYRPRAAVVLQEIGRTLRWWSLGQVADMVTVGVLTGVGLTLLGVPLSFALGVLAGLLTFVPYFGAVVAAVPAMMVGLTLGWRTSLWVLVIFLISHAVESYVVAPLVQRRTVRLPPALTILSMTVLGTVFGPLGVILGTPIAAASLVVVREVYVRDVLGDSEVSGGC
jgi:predicted PurR-regulated permease PerM